MGSHVVGEVGNFTPTIHQMEQLLISGSAISLSRLGVTRGIVSGRGSISVQIAPWDSSKNNRRVSVTNLTRYGLGDIHVLAWSCDTDLSDRLCQRYGGRAMDSLRC